VGIGVTVFVCYSRKDSDLKAELLVALDSLRRDGIFQNVWSDSDIEAGARWSEEIRKNIDNADIILLLISFDFLASDYIIDIEMKRALERHESGDAAVIPIILRECVWPSRPFAKLQTLPSDGQKVLPVKDWASKDGAFTTIAVEVERVAVGLLKKRSTGALQPDEGLSQQSRPHPPPQHSEAHLKIERIKTQPKSAVVSILNPAEFEMSSIYSGGVSTTGGVSSVTFAGPDHILSGGYSGSLLLWDKWDKQSTVSKPRALPGHQRAISAVVLTDGGSPQVISSSFDRIIVHDLQDPSKPTEVYGAPDKQVQKETRNFFPRFLFFLAATKRILAVSPRGEIRKWDLSSCEPIKCPDRLNTNAGEIQWITAARKQNEDGTLFCGSSVWARDPNDPAKAIWLRTSIGLLHSTTATWKTLWDLKPEYFAGCEGLRLSVDSLDYRNGLVAVGISETKKTHGLPETKATIKIFNYDDFDPDCMGSFPQDHRSPIRALKLCEDGAPYLISGSADHTIGIRELRMPYPNRTYPNSIRGHYGWVNALDTRWTEKGVEIVSGSFDGTSRVWNLREALKTNPEWEHSARVRSIAVGGGIVASGSFDNTIQFRKLDATHCQGSTLYFDDSGQIRDLAFTAEGTHLVSAHSNGEVKLWDVSPVIEHHKPPLPLSLKQDTKHTRDVFGVAVSSDAKVVLSASEDRNIIRWDRANQEATYVSRPIRRNSQNKDESSTSASLESLKDIGHDGGVNTVAITPCGRIAVTGADDMNVRRWKFDERGSKVESKVMRGHRFGGKSHCDQVLDVAINHNGTKALSASKDCCVKLWDLDRCREILKLCGHKGWVLAVAFWGPDDGWGVSASVDGEVKIWNLNGPGRDDEGFKPHELAHLQTHATLYSCAVVGNDRLVAGDASGGLHFLRLVRPDQKSK
jgi:WD40 repeat protein